jgi:hypothetical protein
VSTCNVPPGCGTSAATSLATPGTFVQSKGTIVDPLAVHVVITRVMVTVPVGVTDHVCAAIPPSAVVAVTLNAFATRDSTSVGVHVSVLPLNAAPAGPLVSA